MTLRWRRSKSSGSLFLKNGKRALAMVFTRRDGRGFSWWAAGLGEDPAVYATEESTIESLYTALGM
jgi:hypothetical protein